MKFRCVAAITLVAIPIPTALLLSRFLPRASAHPPRQIAISRATQHLEDQSNPFETVTVLSDSQPQKAQVAEKFKGPAIRAQWVVEFPEMPRSGQFVIRGRLEINPDAARKQEEIAVSVLVDDAETGTNLDSRNHGILVADPAEHYTKNVSEKFDLPSGVHRIRFLADYPNVTIRHQDGSSSPPWSPRQLGS
jgi:hypothetical protein